MTREEFKTIVDMVRMIIDGSKDKEDALKNRQPDNLERRARKQNGSLKHCP